MNPFPIIIDTDPGIDDVLAIIVASACDRLNILGLTPVDGNVKAELTFKNAIDLRDYLGMECEVAKGASTQLTHPLKEHAEGIHGESGIGDVVLPAATRPFSPLDAWDFMYEKAREYPGELRIVAVGPLTNVATFIKKYPDAGKLVKEILVMGGGVSMGNSTPFSEFNFYADPVAADIVFTSGIPIVMAPLNCTMKTGIPIDYLMGLADEDTRIAYIIRGISEKESRRKVVNKDGEISSPVHDAIPLFYLAHPEACETRRCRIKIYTEDYDEHWGESQADFDDEDAFNTTLITDVDMTALKGFYAVANEYYKRK